MWYYDMDILGNSPRVPTWDLIALIVAGVIIVCGDQTATNNIETPDGIDMDGTSDEATAQLRQGQDLSGYFFPLVLSDAFAGGVRGRGPQILLSGQPKVLSPKHPLAQQAPSPQTPRRLQLFAEGFDGLDENVISSAGSGFEQLVSSCRAPETPQPTYSEEGGCHNEDDNGNCSDEPSDDPPVCPGTPVVQPDPVTATTPLPPIEANKPSVPLSQPGSFSHTITGTKRISPLIYFAKSTLTRFELRNGNISSAESLKVHARNIGTADAHYELDLDRQKEFSFRLSQRHGLTASGLSVELLVRTLRAGTLRITSPPGLFIVSVVPSHQRMIAEAKAVIKSASKGGWVSQAIDLDGYLGPGGVRFKICPSLVSKAITVASLGAGGSVLDSTLIEGPPVPR